MCVYIHNINFKLSFCLSKDAKLLVKDSVQYSDPIELKKHSNYNEVFGFTNLFVLVKSFGRSNL